jgi:DNA-binding HxlR family transcriptional regulator
MSSKDNVAINQLLGLLEARYAIRVLWALRDGHPQTFRLLQDSVGADLLKRLSDLPAFAARWVAAQAKKKTP